MYKSSRDGFSEKLTELATNPNIWVVSCDMQESLGLSKFKELAPERFIECGIAEQAAMTIAAGISMANKDNIVFIATFAEFMPMRNLDQIRISVCMQDLNVKIVSSHVGLSYGADGESVQVLEDLGAMQSLNNLTIFSPSCFEEAELLTQELANINGPCYMRLNREPEEMELKELNVSHSFVWKSDRKSEEVYKKKILLISHGATTSECIKVIDKLKPDNISASLYNCSQIKPIKPDLFDIIKISGYNNIFVVEEHNRIGGLGTTLAALFAENNLLQDRKFNIIALDRFGESARTANELRSKLEIDADGIYKRIKILT